MRYLLRYSQREEIQSFVRFATSDPGVQGIVVDLDPRWLQLQYATANWTRPERDQFVDDLMHHRWEAWLRHDEAWSSTLWGQSAWPPDMLTIDYPDPDVVQPEWAAIAGALDLPLSPYVVTVVRRPGAQRASYNDFPSLRIETEIRPVATLRRGRRGRVRPVVGGVSTGAVGSTLSGTLGGILEDARQMRFGLTCAHVVDLHARITQPAAADHWYGTRATGLLGTCVARSDFDPSSNLCNEYFATNLLDVALIAVEPGVQSDLSVLGAGAIQGVAQVRDIGTCMSAEVFGKETGRNPVRTGALCVIYQFRIGKTTFCFRNLIELRNRGAFYGIHGTLREPVANGDSGAWVLIDGPTGPMWAAMAIGGDSATGYAIFAENVVEWLRVGGYDLRAS